MGLQSIAADCGVAASLSLEIDASAAVGIIQRQGLGKTRRVEVGDLWLQEKVRMKKLEIRKINARSNAADLGTKPLSADVIKSHMRRMGYY